MSIYQKPRLIEVTVANNGTTSDVIDINDRTIAGIITPAALTSTAITFLVSDARDGTYVALKDSDNAAVSLTVTTSTAYGLSGVEADALSAFPFARLVCGSAEGGARTIKCVLK